MIWKDYINDFTARLLSLPCLVGTGYAQGYTLTGLFLAVLLGFHTLILARPVNLEKGLGPRRFAPWLIVGSCFFVLCYGPDRTFEVPTYPTEPPQKKLADVPLTLDGLSVGMTPERVKKLKGKPAAEELQYTLLPAVLDAWTTKEILKKLIETDLGPEVKNEVLGVLQVYEKSSVEPEPQNGIRDQRTFFAESYPRPDSKPQLQIVERLPQEDEYETLLNGREDLKAGGFDIFLVCPNSQSSLILTGHGRKMWSFSDNGKDTVVAFSSEEPYPVEVIFGSELVLGTRPWLRTGQLVSRLNLPGPPLRLDENGFLKYEKAEQLFVKEFFDKKVYIGVEDERATSIRMGI